MHADELCLAIFLRALLHHYKLVGPHTAGSDLARFDKVVQSLHCFFDRNCWVEAMDLEKVKVISQVGKRIIHGGEYRSP